MHDNLTPLQRILNTSHYAGDVDKLNHECGVIRANGGTIVEVKGLMLWGFPVMRETICEPVDLESETHYQFRCLPDDAHDAWFVWLCSGDITNVLDHMPYPLPYIIFARDKRNLRCYSLSALKRRLPKNTCTTPV